MSDARAGETIAIWDNIKINYGSYKIVKYCLYGWLVNIIANYPYRQIIIKTPNSSECSQSSTTHLTPYLYKLSSNIRRAT